MLELIPILFGLAVVDSINPSVLAITFALLLSEIKNKNKFVLIYILSIFFTYLIIGILLTLGLQTFFTQINEFYNTKEAYYIQGIIGALMFIWSWFPSKKKKSEDNFFIPDRILKIILLGITITIAELATALPYLGAIVLLHQSHLSLFLKIIILIFYNIIMMLPPLLVLFVYNLNKKRFDLWLSKRKDKKPSQAIKWILGIIGFLLLADAIYFILF